MPKKEFRLCYVRHNVMYFTDDFDHCGGDDWNDKPYEYNAEPPYEWFDEWTAEENIKDCHTHIRYIAYMVWDVVREPQDYGEYCVDDINKGAVPWLTLGWDYDGEEAPKLYAGATIDEAIEWLKQAGAKWGELK